MEVLDKFATTLAGAFKDLPHIPENGRKWLAVNLWWLVLISVVLQVIAILASLGAIFASFGLALALGVAGYAVFAAVGGIIAIVLRAAVALVFALSIAPLKRQVKQGWSLVFIAVLGEIATLVLSLILAFGIGSIFALIFGGVVLVALLWLLVEIRSHFGTSKKSDTKTETKVSS